MSCLTCNSCQAQSTMPIISASEKTIAFAPMERKSDDVSDVENTSPWGNSIDVAQEPIKDIAGPAKWNTNGNGGPHTRAITATTCASGPQKSGPSRFFQQVSWQLDQAEPVYYQAKAGKSERNRSLRRFVWKLENRDHRRIRSDAAIDEYWRWKGFAFPGKGWDEWLNRTGQPARKRTPIPYTWGNIHSTVKPIELARYLATLLLPPPEYAPRRLLIPFGGVGSEAIGAMLAGWEEIVVIEQSEEYCQIAQARVDWWLKRMQEMQTTDPKVILKSSKKPKKAKEQGKLF